MRRGKTRTLGVMTGSALSTLRTLFGTALMLVGLLGMLFGVMEVIDPVGMKSQYPSKIVTDHGGIRRGVCSWILAGLGPAERKTSDA
jgi:hypothetical protein